MISPEKTPVAEAQSIRCTEDAILYSSRLRTIVVDLTPVLPGGENGGAKVFVLELLRRLAQLAPQTQFVLLTQAASHAELAALDSANFRRLMVINLDKPASRRTAGGKSILPGADVSARAAGPR